MNLKIQKLNMADPVDILLDDDFDVEAENGDFKTGDATLQNQD